MIIVSLGQPVNRIGMHPNKSPFPWDATLTCSLPIAQPEYGYTASHHVRTVHSRLPSGLRRLLHRTVDRLSDSRHAWR